MRKVYIILITSIVVLLLLLISWYAVWEILANRITKTYGKRDITVYQQDSTYSTISFSTVKAITTPLSIGFDVLGVTISSISDSNISKIIKCDSPIKIRYSLASKIFLIEYSGQCYSKQTYDSNDSKSSFNNNVVKIDATISSELKLSKRLFQILKEHNAFELINYLNHFKLNVREFSDYDNVKNLLKNKILKSYFHISFDNHPYYYSVDDLRNDIPKNYAIDSKITVDHMNYSFSPWSFEFKSTLDLLLPKVSWYSITKNIEQNSFNGQLSIEKLFYEDNKLAVSSKIDYQNLAHRENKNNKLATYFVLNIKDKLSFIKILLASIVNIDDEEKTNSDITAILQKMENFDFKTAMQNIAFLYTDNDMSLQKKECLAKLDYFDQIINTIAFPNQIMLNLDFELLSSSQSNIFRLNFLKILLNDFGIDIKDSLYDTTNPRFVTNFYLLNFRDLVDFIIDFYNIKTIIENHIKLNSKENKIDENILQQNQLVELNKDILKSFLSKISKPLHDSPNIRVINCHYDISNKIRIGNLDLLAIRGMYYRTLYNQVREIITKSSTPSKLILKFLPQLQQKSDLIDKLNRSPEIITQELWMEVLKSLLEAPACQ